MKITNADVIAYFDDAGEVETGEYHKHDTCFATRTLDVTQTDVDECPALAPYLGMQLSQQGTKSYNYGFETYEDIEVYQKVSKQTEQAAFFWELMSHLNSEDNEMAFKYSQKFQPDVVVYEKEKSPIKAATLAMAKGGLNDEADTE